jgi:hypothetical protein
MNGTRAYGRDIAERAEVSMSDDICARKLFPLAPDLHAVSQYELA